MKMKSLLNNGRHHSSYGAGRRDTGFFGGGKDYRPARFSREQPIILILTITVFLVAVQVLFPTMLPALTLRTLGPWLALRPTAPPAVEESNESALFTQALIDDNTVLKGMQTGSTTPSASLRRIAAVIAVPPALRFDTLILEVDRASGAVLPHTPVFIGAVPIGVITDTYDHYARAMLFSSPGQVYEVVVGTSSLRIEAHGRGNGMFEAVVPREARVRVGDVVVAPGLSLHPLGKVEYITQDAAKPFVSFFFRIPFSLQHIRYVTLGDDEAILERPLFLPEKTEK
jgi:hypothetical protein